jgi:hypothetical protein
LPLITFDDYSNPELPEPESFVKYKRFKSVPNALDTELLYPNYPGGNSRVERYVHDDLTSYVGNSSVRRLSTQLQRRRESLTFFSLLPTKEKALEYHMNGFDRIAEDEEERDRARDQVRLYVNMRKRRSLVEKQNALFGKMPKKSSKHVNEKAFRMLDGESRSSSLHRKSSTASQAFDEVRPIFLNECVTDPFRFSVAVVNFVYRIREYLEELPHGYFVIFGLFFTITLSIIVSFLQLINKGNLT